MCAAAKEITKKISRQERVATHGSPKANPVRCGLQLLLATRSVGIYACFCDRLQGRRR
jgi:hypothetical protein